MSERADTDGVPDPTPASGRSGARVLRNSAGRAIGFGLGSAVFFLVVVLIARTLGVEGFGHYSFIMAVAGLFQLLADMGVRNIVIRDVALDPGLTAERVGVARGVLVVLSVVSLVGMFVLSFPLSATVELRQSMWLAGLAVMLTFHALAYSAVLRAREEMGLDIRGFVYHKLALLALVAAAGSAGLGLRGVFSAQLLANLLLWLYYRRLVISRHGPMPIRLDRAAGLSLLKESVPLGIAELLRRLTWQVDRLLLAALATPEALGLYSTAYKFTEAMRPFASNLTLPAFPVLSRLAHGPRERLTAGVRRLLRLLHLGGMPFAILIAVLADRIVTPVFGPRFAGASALLPWLAPVLFLLPPVSLYGYLAVALGRQRLYTIAVALALAVNTVLDLLLIPGHQAAGAAMATLAAEVVLYLAGILLLDETGGIKACLEHLWRPVVAGAAMAAVCWPLGDLPLPAVAAGAAFALVLYLALLLALGALTRAEVGAVLDRLRRRTGSG